MKIDYNIIGDKRKSFVGALSARLNLPTKYLGMPSASYEVGAYCISKTGLLEGSDDHVLVAQLRDNGFEPITEEYDGEKNPEVRDATEARETSPREPERLSIEVPMTGFTPEKIDNLIKMVNAKAPLLKAVLGADDLPIRHTDEDSGKLCFPWFDPNSDADHVKAYATLIAKLCETVKGKKRVIAKERELPDNPKYAMRCWLLALGFIGPDCREARHILLSGLSGSGAYKSGAKNNPEAQGETDDGE